MNLAKERIDKFLLIVVPLVILLGNISLFNIRLMGIVLTSYRVLIPLIFIYCLFNINKRNFISNKYLKLLVIFSAVWLIWAVVLTFSSDYAVIKESLKEILNLVLGICDIFIILSMVKDDNDYKLFFTSIRICIGLLIIFAIFEMITGFHLETSMLTRYYIRNCSRDSAARFIASRQCTTIFYNMNDFCAFLTCFGILFVPKKEYKRKKSVLYALVLMVIYLIFIHNDAWISFMGLTLSIVIYFILNRYSIKSWIIYITGLLFTNFIGMKVLFKIIKTLEYPMDALFGRTSGTSIAPGEDISTNLFDAVSLQVNNAAGGVGSLYLRINTYLETIKATLFDSYGLGFGPHSFGVYAKWNFDDSVLLNTHNMWTEILFNYGVLIFALFTGACIWLILNLYKIHKNKKDDISSILIAMDIALVFSSIVPSSFFGISYMWIPIGLSFVYVISNKKLESGKIYEKR